MDEYWEEYGEYDAAVSELKDALRASVKTEIKEQIASLTTANRDLKSKLQKLDRLEADAAREKSKYERELADVKRTAYREVRKEELGKLIQAIDERLYTVERVYTKREKCDRCNDQRQIKYTTPRGRETYETCECSESESHWEAAEVAAHEVARRDGRLIIWWSSTRRWGDEDQLSPRVLKRSVEVDLESLVAHPQEYSFPDLLSAQAVAHALNEAVSDAV